jgi:hypothetical protein
VNESTSIGTFLALKSGDRSSHRRHFNSNSNVLTTRIFFAGVLVGLYGADSSLPSNCKDESGNDESGLGKAEFFTTC